jgi:hypothetical protein
MLLSKITFFVLYYIVVRDCTHDLSGNGGGTSVRTCKVPAGKGLFIPVSPMEVSDKEAPNRSVEDLHKIAKKDQDSVTSLYLKINDKEYNRAELSKYRIHPGVIEVTFPKKCNFRGY